MKKLKFLTLGISTALIMSCSSEASETEAAGSGVDIQAEATKACECYNTSGDDTGKFLECEAAKEKVLESIKDENTKKEFNKKVAQCLEG